MLVNDQWQKINHQIDQTSLMTFIELGLSEQILKVVSDSGFKHPTPIQQQAIPTVLQGRDVLGCAQTGTGKTASFTLPMIDILAAGQPKARMPRSLIIEPTRELAAQVAQNFEQHSKYHQLTWALLIGGVRMNDQEKLIERGVDVLIVTPGRLLDHALHGGLLLGGIKILVIDEADKMLDMGFIPDVEQIVKLAPPSRQTLLFSATMPKEIRILANRFLSNPKEIHVAPPASPAETVDQSTVIVDQKYKKKALLSLLNHETVPKALIFCNRKRDIAALSRSLNNHGFKAAELHGDMAQPARMSTLERFTEGELELLVCSDVAARGLDIEALPFVFLFDVPSHPEDYVHRIGRTGRAGMTGKAVTFATPEDGKSLDAIETLKRKKIIVKILDEIPQTTLTKDLTKQQLRKPSINRSANQGSKTKQTNKRQYSSRSRTGDALEKDAPGDKSVVGMGDNFPAFMSIAREK